LAPAAERPLDWLFSIPDANPPSEGGGGRRFQPQDERLPPGVPYFVVRGTETLKPCNGCHQPSGSGSPETANLRGLPAAYVEATMKGFRDGTRGGLRAPPMVTIAKGLTEHEVTQIADYYASLAPIPWVKVVESAAVPKTYVTGDGGRRLRPEGGEEPLNLRIIEYAPDQIGLRAAKTYAFIAYVPPGSIALGEGLAHQGGERSPPCTACHGEDLKGAGDIPGLAGRSPLYIARQLTLFQLGQRHDGGAAPMRAVAANLHLNEIVALAAYLGSLDPS
jgi:cytochrome c553